MFLTLGAVAFIPIESADREIHCSTKLYKCIYAPENRRALAKLSSMNNADPSQPGKRMDQLSRFLLSVPQFVEALEIQPEFRACAEEMRQAQSGVARDGACSVQDLRDPIRRDVKVARQFRGTHVELFKFLSQVFAGMYLDPRHKPVRSIVR